MDERHGGDAVSVTVEEVIVPTLTDILLRVCRKTLEKNRAMLNANANIRSVTLTIRLTELGKPYKVLLVPSHESNGEGE